VRYKNPTPNPLLASEEGAYYDVSHSSAYRYIKPSNETELITY
jgi:hypothetical protein